MRVVTRLPPKSERRAYLRAHGWVRVGSYGAETWQHRRFERFHYFTLAAAYRCERDLNDERSTP